MRWATLPEICPYGGNLLTLSTEFGPAATLGPNFFMELWLKYKELSVRIAFGGQKMQLRYLNRNLQRVQIARKFGTRDSKSRAKKAKFRKYLEVITSKSRSKKGSIQNTIL